MDSRSGLTLLEMLLVIALITILASLAMPLFEESFESIRLRQGTDQVIAIWSRTRSAAIESGQIHLFRYQAQTGDYRVEPLHTESEAPDRLPPERVTTGAKFTESSSAAWFDENGSAIFEASLPESIIIRTGESLDTRQGEDAAGGQSDKEATTRPLDNRADREWSAPILFYPDGTTSDASLLVESRRQQQRVTLRGLTGVARTGESRGSGVTGSGTFGVP